MTPKSKNTAATDRHDSAPKERTSGDSNEARLLGIIASATDGIISVGKLALALAHAAG